MGSKSLRGVTLVELLVALALTALVTTLLVSLLLSGHQAWLRSDARSTALQNALLVMTRVREEVRDSAPDSTLCLPFPAIDASGHAVSHDALLLVSWRIWDGTELTWDPSGAILWQSVLAMYVDPTTGNALMRERLLPAALPDAPDLTAADLAPQPGDQVRVVAHNIDSLSFTPQGSAVVGVVVHALVNSTDVPLDGSATATVPSNTRPSPSPTP